MTRDLHGYRKVFDNSTERYYLVGPIEEGIFVDCSHDVI